MASCANLPALVTRRLGTLSYLRRCLCGEAHWLNVVRLTAADVEHALGGSEGERTGQFFFLGFSLAKLLDLPRGSIVARAAAQLLAEYSHHVERTEKRGREPKTKDQEEVQIAANLSAAVMVDNLNMPVRAELRRVGRRVVYDYFEVPRSMAAGVRLCYSQVVVSLLDTLIVLYNRFVGDSSCTQQESMAEAVFRIDRQIVDAVVSRVAADLALAAGPVLKRELKGFVESLYADTHLDADGNFVNIREQTRRTNVVVGTLAHSSASSLLFDDDDEEEATAAAARDDSDEDLDDDDDDDDEVVEEDSDDDDRTAAPVVSEV